MFPRGFRLRQIAAVALITFAVSSLAGLAIGLRAAQPYQVTMTRWPSPCPWGGVLVVDASGRVVDLVCWRLALMP